MITNPVSIATDNLETDYTNNNDTASTILGDFANVWTEIDCDPIGYLDQEASCIVDRGNDGNMTSVDGTVEIQLDPHVTYVTGSVTGLQAGETCTYTTGTPHFLLCEGGRFETLTVGDEFTL